MKTVCTRFFPLPPEIIWLVASTHLKNIQKEVPGIQTTNLLLVQKKNKNIYIYMKNKISCYKGFLSFPISCLLSVKFVNKHLDPSSLSTLMSSNIIYWIYYSMIPLQQKKRQWTRDPLQDQGHTTTTKLELGLLVVTLTAERFDLPQEIRGLIKHNKALLRETNG